MDIADKMNCPGLSGICYLIISVFLSVPSVIHAGPDGSNIVGGTGSITTNNLTTTVNQNTQSMAIDWNSYNLNSNEIVNYLQPNSSSFSLNRILGGSASQIHGQINANGQVILVNPNGLFFGQGASINVGGLIASSLDIDPVDFMNGDFIFNEVVGTDGFVINSGLINASLGGNIALLGKQVKNEGVINAKLGVVSLAAGKEAVLTFDQQGLLGVRVSKEVLQDELGIDPAVVNSGEINAGGGRVLLTGSVSHDVFSGAVNHDGLEQATSVVVNEDGSFTLGGGADVTNSGAINVSTESGTAGQVVMLGENINHSGSIYSDATNGEAGMIELHGADKTELKGDSVISAQGRDSGRGGDIKILGDKIGLFDMAVVNASGAEGGGEVLIGGDRQGLNNNIRNAQFLYLDQSSKVFADALIKGDGGRIIAFAEDTGRFYGGLFARGGSIGGNGGFIETSGKRGFEIPVAPDVSAVVGEGGLWLIDPFNISIINGDGSGTTNIDTTGTPYFSDGSPAILEIDTILTGLAGGDVEIQTVAGDGGGEAGNITFNADLNYDGTGSKTLTLNATGGIIFQANASIGDGNNSDDSLNINLFAINGVTLGLNSSIVTQGGNFTVGFVDQTTPAKSIIPTSFTNNGTIDTTGLDDANGGDINITTSGTITTAGLTANGGASGGDSNGTNAGSMTMSAPGLISINGDLLATGSDGSDVGGGTPIEAYDGGIGGDINIESTASTITMTGNIINSGGNSAGDNENTAVGGASGDVTLISSVGDLVVGSITSTGGVSNEDGNGGAGGVIAITATNGNIITGDINSNGGDSLDDGTGGVGGNITLTSFDGDITIGNFSSNGGNSTEDGNGGMGGDISLISQSGGDITFINTATALSVSGGIVTSPNVGSSDGNHGNIDLDGNIVLNDNWIITEVINFGAGTIDASPNSANNGYEVNVSAAGEIAISSITTDGGSAVSAGLNAGDVTLSASDIIVGTISAVGSNAIPTLDADGGNGGDVIITATDDGGTPSITLNGDIITNGGAPGNNPLTPNNNLAGITGTKDIRLEGTGGGNTNGSITIGYNGTFSGTLTSGTLTLTSNTDGTDSLNASDIANNWIVNESNSTLNGNITFNGFEVLVGGSSSDSFNLNAPDISGVSIDGVSATDNSVTRGTGTNDWVLTGTYTGTLNADFVFDNIQTLIGGTGTDTLTGIDQANLWTLTSANDGSVAENILTPADTVAFSNMDNFNGGTGVDVFDLTSIAGPVAVELQSGTLPTASIHITNAEQIDANDAFINTLIADEISNDWIIDNPNSGTINTSLRFNGFRNLTGGTDVDNFVFSGGGQLNGGTIDGGAGTGNSVTGLDATNDWTLNAPDTGSLAFNSTVTFLASIQTFTGGSAIDTLTVTVAGPRDWEITGSNSGTISGLTAGFSNIENLVGNADVDTFTLNGGTISGTIDGLAGSDILNADNVANIWLISVINGGSVTGVGSFSSIENLNGNSQLDSFILQGGTVSGAIDGGDSQSDSLQADNALNSWTINGSNSGNVTGVAGFSNIENLSGGNQTDSFTFTSGGSIAGLINGGLGTDSLNIAAVTGDMVVEVGNNVSANLNILDLESLTAGIAANNTLIADNQVNDWQVTGAGAGSLNNMSFIGFNQLEGNFQNDTFEFFDGWSIANGIDAGTGGNDIADGNAVTTLSFQIGTGFLDNFESFIGNNTDSTLIGDNSINAWTINSNNGGTINTQSFEQFSQLVGNAQVDTFDVLAGGALTGNASGGDGDDIANITLSGNENGSFEFDGEAGNDTVNLNGGNAAYLGEYNSDVGGGLAQLAYSQAVNIYSVRYIRTETVNDNISSANLNINGSAGDDNIILDSNAFTVNTATTVNHNGNTSLSIDGLAGSDSVTGAIAATVSAATLRIDNVNTVGSQASQLNTAINLLELNNVSGAVFINEIDQVSLGALNNFTGALTLTNQSGDIFDNAALTSSANLQLNALNGNIQLDDANQLGGELSFSAVNGNVELTNNTVTQLASIDAQNLDIAASADITDIATAQIRISGSTTIQAGNADIILDSGDNQFSSLNVSSANNLTLIDNDSNGLAIGNISVDSNADISTAGALTDANGTANNVQADILMLSATSGIGSNEALEIAVNQLDAVNTGGGEVNLSQNGSIEIIRLQNTGSDGDVTFSSDTDIFFSPDSTVANITAGSLLMTTDTGSFLGLGAADITRPDITAQNAIFIGRQGTFGTLDRNLVLNIPGDVFVDTRGSFNPQFVIEPASFVSEGIDFTVIGTISAVAGEQLVEIESLSEVDPAIFTALRNYSHEDISIRMPRDQLYDDESEDNAGTQ